MISQESAYNYIISHIRSGACRNDGHEIWMECPSCQGDDTHFSVNIFKNRYNCFKCPCGGSIAAQVVLHRSEWLALVRPNRQDQPTERVGKAFSGFSEFAGASLWSLCYPELFGRNGSERKGLPAIPASTVSSCFRYCRKRGLTDAQIKDYNVWVMPYQARVYFPVWDLRGQIEFYMGRAINDYTEPKTIEPKDANKPLFGRHVNKLKDNVVLVEGVFDHFATPNSYAIMGSNITTYQMVQLAGDGVKKVFLLLDPDANEKSQANASKLAKVGIKVVQVLLDGGKDPGDIGREKMGQVVTKIAQCNAPAIRVWV